MTYFNGSLDDGISNLGIQAIVLFIDVSTGPLEVAKRMNHRKLHTHSCMPVYDTVVQEHMNQLQLYSELSCRVALKTLYLVKGYLAGSFPFQAVFSFPFLYNV